LAGVLLVVFGFGFGGRKLVLNYFGVKLVVRLVGMAVESIGD